MLTPAQNPAQNEAREAKKPAKIPVFAPDLTLGAFVATLPPYGLRRPLGPAVGGTEFHTLGRSPTDAEASALMPFGSPLLVAAVLLLQSNTPRPEICPTDFTKWFQAAADGALVVSPGVESRAQTFRYVFVGGFGSERLNGYFAECARTLKSHGVSADSIHGIFPDSQRSLEGNRDAVRNAFAKITTSGPERLVIIAHSRGACDALAFALRDPEFVKKYVHAMFLVQGAFGGSGLADFLMGEGSAMDRQLPLRYRVAAGLAGGVGRVVLRPARHEGVAALTREDSEEFWQDVCERHADAIPVVGPKTFYITSQIAPSRLRLFPRAVAEYLETYYGPNDGVVLLKDQTLPGLGTLLGIVEAGHGDLTHHTKTTRSSRRLRVALVQSILMAVGGGAKEPMLTVLRVERAPKSDRALRRSAGTRRR